MASLVLGGPGMSVRSGFSPATVEAKPPFGWWLLPLLPSAPLTCSFSASSRSNLLPLHLYYCTPPLDLHLSCPFILDTDSSILL